MFVIRAQIHKMLVRIAWFLACYNYDIQNNLENLDVDFSQYSLIQNKFGPNRIQRIEPIHDRV